MVFWKLQQEAYCSRQCLCKWNWHINFIVREDAFKSMVNSKKASKLSNVAATQWSLKLKLEGIVRTSGGGLM